MYTPIFFLYHWAQKLILAIKTEWSTIRL
jgi:hypothetical protein